MRSLGNDVAAKGVSFTLESLPRRIRDIATLRGLGYTFRTIADLFEVSPQAVSVMLSRHRKRLSDLCGEPDLAGLSSRAVNALGRHGISTRAAATNHDMLSLLKGERNCGNKTLNEIQRWLEEASNPAQYTAGNTDFE